MKTDSSTGAVVVKPALVDTTCAVGLARSRYGDRYGIDWIYHDDQLGTLFSQLAIDNLSAEVDLWKSRFSQARSDLAKLHDDTAGTPCEQIRHAQELAEVTERAERAEAEITRLQSEIDNKWASGIHTCGPMCQRAECVLRREADELRSDAEEAKRDQAAALGLLSRMRFACGDDGKRMQDELEAYLGELRRDAGRWRWMRDSRACSISVTHNDHQVAYSTVTETLGDPQDQNDYYGDVPAEEREQMIAQDSIWTLHIYPDTPVGFYVHHSASLDGAIDAAMAGEVRQ
ncbi:hypothetical protein ACYX7E_10055 [Luteimonas sp. RIT-PG2_3]